MVVVSVDADYYYAAEESSDAEDDAAALIAAAAAVVAVGSVAAAFSAGEMSIGDFMCLKYHEPNIHKKHVAHIVCDGPLAIDQLFNTNKTKCKMSLNETKDDLAS